MNEKEFLKKYYGASLNVDAIDLGVLPDVMKTIGIGGMSPWPGKILLPQNLFRNGDPDSELVLENSKVARDFAHESFHVWQRQHGRLGVAIDGLFLGIPRRFGGDVYGFARNSAHGIYIQFLQGGLEQQARIFEQYVVADMVGNARAKRLFVEVAAYIRSRPL